MPGTVAQVPSRTAAVAGSRQPPPRRRPGHAPALGGRGPDRGIRQTPAATADSTGASSSGSSRRAATTRTAGWRASGPRRTGCRGPTAASYQSTSATAASATPSRGRPRRVPGRRPGARRLAGRLPRCRRAEGLAQRPSRRRCRPHRGPRSSPGGRPASALAESVGLFVAARRPFLSELGVDRPAAGPRPRAAQRADLRGVLGACSTGCSSGSSRPTRTVPPDSASAVAARGDRALRAASSRSRCWTSGGSGGSGFQLIWAVGMLFYGIAAGCEALAAIERTGTSRSTAAGT